MENILMEDFFVTIYTYKRAKYFGEVVNNNVILSELGKYAKYCWEEIPHHLNLLNQIYL